MDYIESRRLINKHYAQGVIEELQQLGYHGEQAKNVFFRHYKGMKRVFGLEPNVSEFAKLIDEFERGMNRKYNENDPNRIYIGHLRHIVKKNKI
ncbi:hypothetical protein [Paenibacillus sp. FSL H8-0537]|uniref:hypothetical protein n=1 Tax=Paenibacillus sp. FSL H8-0537 TaxID=2921399 RepID=UPI003101845D